MNAVVTSRHNPLLKLARQVRDGRGEPSRELMFIEGLRLSEEALAAKVEIEEAIISERFAGDEESERAAKVLDTLRERARRTTFVSDDALASAADTASPQGVLLLARRPPSEVKDFEKALSQQQSFHSSNDAPLLVILHKISNPSNVGAMLRAAEAAGANGVIMTRGSADVFSPKSLRGAMGSCFRLPLWTNADFNEAMRWCDARKIKTVAAELRAEKTHAEIDWKTPRALIVGSEAHGLSKDEIEAASERVRIPMRPPVESLNAAVALGVVLYEAARQRNAI